MAPFDRSHTSSYSFSIVAMAICRTVTEIFSVDLEIWVACRSRSLKMVPLESLGMVSYSYSLVTMWRYLVSSASYRVIGRKSQNYYNPLAFSAPAGGDPSEFRRNSFIKLK